MSSLSCSWNAARCVLSEPNVYKKLEMIAPATELALAGCGEPVPLEVARDVPVLSIGAFPPRPGLQSPSGQVRLLHDLANIELQAMELGLRTLLEFPQSPLEFREQLQNIILEEAHHLRLCLELMEQLGGRWGDWPIHLGLWSAVAASDTLLERVFIVHRYLESSGLDAGERLLERLSGVKDKRIDRVVRRIVQDEVGHVTFGSQWYFDFCRRYNVDAFSFYQEATRILVSQHPRKEHVSQLLREQAGYSRREIEELIQLRKGVIAGDPR